MTQQQRYGIYKIILFAIVAVGLILSFTGIWVSPINDTVTHVCGALYGIVCIADNRYKKRSGQQDSRTEYIYAAAIIFYCFSQLAHYFV